MNNTNVSKIQNEYTYCDIKEDTTRIVATYIDLSNCVIVPFIIMITCSILITKAVFQSRKKLMTNQANNKKNKQAQKIYRRDAQFSATIIILNVSFFVLNLPISLFSLFGYEGDFGFLLLDIIFFSQYIVNIFVYLFLNSMFKEEFKKILAIFGLCKRAASLNSSNGISNSTKRT